MAWASYSAHKVMDEAAFSAGAARAGAMKEVVEALQCMVFAGIAEFARAHHVTPNLDCMPRECPAIGVNAQRVLKVIERAYEAGRKAGYIEAKCDLPLTLVMTDAGRIILQALRVFV